MTTAETILDIAAELVQRRGFNGFSFQDVADRVGIRKASLHHHFATKAQLGEALVERYRRDALAVLGEPDGPGHRDRLDRYLGVFTGLAGACDRYCLIGMLAAEYLSLPEGMRARIGSFVSEVEAWLARLLGDGRRAGAFRFDGSPAEMASTILAALEGGLLFARFGPSADRMARVVFMVRRLLGLTEEERSL